MAVNEITGAPTGAAKYLKCGAKEISDDASQLAGSISSLLGESLSYVDKFDRTHKLTPDPAQMTEKEWDSYQQDIQGNDGVARSLGLPGVLYSFVKWFVLFTTGRGDALAQEDTSSKEKLAVPDNGPVKEAS
ncbi:MAG: hypothetical protein PHH14_07155 [Candidatus Margulisbacteria bacterium]|nr:hypothetical protein [Candidatus Margulisiibacteriota bacterium]